MTTKKPEQASDAPLAPPTVKWSNDPMEPTPREEKITELAKELSAQVKALKKPEIKGGAVE